MVDDDVQQPPSAERACPSERNTALPGFRARAEAGPRSQIEAY